MFSWIITLKRSHGPSWYLWALIGVVSLAIWGFLTEIYALSIAVVILAGVYLLIENNAPETVEVTVDENGIGIDTSFYDYGQLESFRIVFDGKLPKFLNLTLKEKVMKSIEIPLTQDVNVSELRSFLSQYVFEWSSGSISFSERITDMLGL